MRAERVKDSDLGRQAVAHGIADESQVAGWAAGWRRWAADPDGWFVVVHGEAILRPGH